MIDDLVRLEWYGASVEYERGYGAVVWAYIEIRAYSQEHAKAQLVLMLRDNIKINYCQLV
jgi:hypothetical protein